MNPTTACDTKNDNRKLNTLASYATKKSGIEYQGFLLRFCHTEMNLIAFSSPRNCVNTQYAALSGAMLILKPRHAEYCYYTLLSKFYPVILQHSIYKLVFSIKVEKSMDPDQIA